MSSIFWFDFIYKFAFEFKANDLYFVSVQWSQISPCPLLSSSPSQLHCQFHTPVGLLPLSSSLSWSLVLSRPMPPPTTHQPTRVYFVIANHSWHVQLIELKSHRSASHRSEMEQSTEKKWFCLWYDSEATLFWKRQSNIELPSKNKPLKVYLFVYLGNLTFKFKNCSQCEELLHGHMETAKRMEDTDVLSMLLLLLPRLVRLRLFLLLLDHTLLPSVSFFPSGRLPRSSCNNYSIWFTPPHPISLAPFVILRRVPFLLGLAHCCYHTWIAAKCVARWRRHSLHLFSPVYLSLCHLPLKRKSLLLQRKWI